MMLAIDKSPPAPAPWTALPAMSIARETAAPQRALPREKIATAVSSTAFRPQTSLNFPQFGVEAAAPRRKAEPTQTYPDAEWK